jgi:hypothetical protein
MRYFVREAVPVSVPENWQGAGVLVYDDRDQVLAVCGDLPTAVILAHALQGWADQGLTRAAAYHRIIERRGGDR